MVSAGDVTQMAILATLERLIQPHCAMLLARALAGCCEPGADPALTSAPAGLGLGA